MYRKHVPLFSRCPFQEHSQATTTRPAHHVFFSTGASEGTREELCEAYFEYVASGFILPNLKQNIYYLSTVREIASSSAGTTFSNSSDEVRLERGHEKTAVVLAPLTGAHRRDHIYPAKL